MRWLKFNLCLLIILIIILVVNMTKNETFEIKRLIIILVLQAILQIEGLIEAKYNV